MSSHTTEFLRQTGEQGALLPAYAEGDVAIIVGRIINVFLSVLGLIFLILTVYAGYLWMTARGNEEIVKKAKETLTNSVIGLILVLVAYSIARFVVGRLVAATAGGG